MRLYLAAPDPDAFVSGGNTYNRNLGGALREMGLAVAISPLIPENPESGDLVVVDSILFDKISPETKIGRNHIALLHHLESLYPLKADRFEQVERPVLSRFSRFIATSDFTRRYLQSRGFARERIIVIEPVAPSLPIYQPPSTGKINALILANIVRRKGILEFLTALAAASVPPDYVLRIV